MVPYGVTDISTGSNKNGLCATVEPSQRL